MRNPFKKTLTEMGLQYRPILGTASAKTIKGEKLNYLTYILHLRPDDIICPHSMLAGCREPCLNTAGRGAFNKVQLARIAKTRFFHDHQAAFMLSVAADIWAAQRKAHKLDMTLLIRLNGTSDIAWENIPVYLHKAGNVFQTFPAVQFYDYTKHPSRKLAGKTANNYDLTYSYSGITPAKITAKALNSTVNSRYAVVFLKRADIPKTFMGMPVIDGDDTDVRHIESTGVVVALYAKGKAKHDHTGFVQVQGVHY